MSGVFEFDQVLNQWWIGLLEPLGEVGIGDHSHMVSLDSPFPKVKARSISSYAKTINASLDCSQGFAV
jgi:hypothetical protein